ncbi:MAG: protein kinase [Planctomycetaceae bacterium]
MKSLWVWPFELEEKIGEGGMGVVYRARYVKNDRRVAVKLLPEDVADETLLARFEREVEILKTLRHPNIVHSFGGVCEDKRRFYAMELVDGGTLEGMLKARGGRLPWEQVVEVGLQICSALQYAHERGVFHRDIKPGNFLLTREHQVKLSDFGLATVVSANKLTASGKTVGSFRYMAPEQVRGDDPAPQTDLYALGCVLFQMIAGRPPFDGSTAAELLKKQLEELPPRLAAFAPECPAALEQVVHALLQKPIESRPASASAVAESLRSVTLTTVADLNAPGQAAAPKQKTNVIPPALRRIPVMRGRLPWGRLSLLGGVLLLVLTCGYLWNRNRQLQRAEQLWIEAFQNATTRKSKIAAAGALGELAAESDIALAALEEGLDSDDADTRRAAVRGLGAAGANAKPLLGKLLSLQRKDEDRDVADGAGIARGKIRDAEESTSAVTIIYWGVVCALIGGGVYVFWRWRRDETEVPTAKEAKQEILRI